MAILGVQKDSVFGYVGWIFCGYRRRVYWDIGGGYTGEGVMGHRGKVYWVVKLADVLEVN